MRPRDRLASLRASALVLFAPVTAALVRCSKDGRREEGLPSPAATAAAPHLAPASTTGEEDALRFDTGHGEDRRAHDGAERWMPDVEATTLQFHAGALWWSGPSGVFERPLEDDGRQVVRARNVAQFVVDGDGLYFVEDKPTGPDEGAEGEERLVRHVPIHAYQNSFTAMARRSTHPARSGRKAVRTRSYVTS